MRLLLIVLAALSIAAQQPPDESNVSPSEKRIPPGHYCKSIPPSARETNAHLCACKYSCSIDENGGVTEHESVDCLTYCHVNGRRCTCHPEGDPSVTCSHGNAVMDMDGNVVAVARRK